MRGSAPGTIPARFAAPVAFGKSCTSGHLSSIPGRKRWLALEALAQYLRPNVDGLWYRGRLAQGQPIGSGLIEGA